MVKSTPWVVGLILLEMIVVVGFIQPAMGGGWQLALSINRGSVTGIEATLDTPIQLKPNQIARLEPEQLHVAFVRVSDDSRCPLDAFCIQAGRITAMFELWKQGQGSQKTAISLTLQPAQEELASQQFEGYAIELLKVEPSPRTNQTIAPEDYRATIVVSLV